MVHLSRPTGTYVELSARQLYFGPKHVYALARRWQRYVAAAEEAGACLGEAAFLQVRYEDLMAAPEQELRGRSAGRRCPRWRRSPAATSSIPRAGPSPCCTTMKGPGSPCRNGGSASISD
ncbi:MAG: sulfotransferase [Gemmatimonadales bacterium]